MVWAALGARGVRIAESVNCLRSTLRLSFSRPCILSAPQPAKIMQRWTADLGHILASQWGYTRGYAKSATVLGKVQ